MPAVLVLKPLRVRATVLPLTVQQLFSKLCAPVLSQSEHGLVFYIHHLPRLTEHNLPAAPELTERDELTGVRGKLELRECRKR